jgi:hypothetical protein
MFFNEKKHIDDERRLVLSGEETNLQAGRWPPVVKAAAAFNDRKKSNHLLGGRQDDFEGR